MDSALLHLLHMCDAGLPVGSFSHSAGLETFVQQNIVHDVASAEMFVIQMLSANIHYNDAAYASLAWQCAADVDCKALCNLNADCTASKLPAEMRQASLSTGKRFMQIFESLTAHQFLKIFSAKLAAKKTSPNFCIAFAAVAQLQGITKENMLQGFYYNAAAAMVTNCVKLIPLGQQQGQEILFRVLQIIHALVQKNLNPQLELLGLSSPLFDVKCMQHEDLYSRLYMS